MPAGHRTRPTADRAREGLFSSLLSLLDLEGARVLDLYAGSGALGLEALSRGAGSATLVEDDPAALRGAARQRRDARAARGARRRPATVERFLAVAPEPRYDLALLDPPYDVDVVPVLEALLPVAGRGRRRRGRAAHPRRRSSPGRTGYEPVRSRRYGEATLWYAVLRRPASVEIMRRAVCPGPSTP